MAVDIKAKPKKVVSNPSISRADGNNKTTLTAKWKVGSALTTTTSDSRATKLKIVWTVTYTDAKGKVRTAKKVVEDKPIGTTRSVFNPRSFTDSRKKPKTWTKNDFWPYGRRRLKKVTFEVFAGNKFGYAAKGAGDTYTFGTPKAPTISALEHDADTGEIYFDIKAYDGRKTSAPRVRTAWRASIFDSRTEKTTRIPKKGDGHFDGDSKKWDKDTPDKIVTDVTRRYLVSAGQYVKVTVEATTESVDGKSSAEKSIVIAYPNPATIDKITVDKLESGAANVGGRVTAMITARGEGGVKSATTGVMLQKLVGVAATTPEQATAMGSEWQDTDIVDDGDCAGLSISVADLMPTRGTHTWIRVKSWNFHENLFFTYSTPKEVEDLYVDPASASDNLHLLSLTSGDDGTSLVADFAWTNGQDPDTGTEVSWSSDEKAWVSTKEPETYETTRNDGAATIGETAYVGTLRIHIQGLEQGEPYHVKGRRYLDPEEGERSFGGYSETLTAIPVSSPTAVVLHAPQTLAMGSDLALSWTFDSEAQQKEWYLLYGTEYTDTHVTETDPDTGETREYTRRDYAIGGDSWLANGVDASGACVVRWNRLAPRLDENGEIGLALRMGTGGSLVTSEPVYLRVVEPPALAATVPDVITKQGFELSLSCNVAADVIVIMRAGTYGEDGMTGGNGGDGLVHQDQTAGDVVWQQYLTPEWTLSEGLYTATVTAPAYLELLDNGNYVLFVQPHDTDTGLSGDVRVLDTSVAWAIQAPRMDDGTNVAPVSVVPSDTVDAAGTRVRQCTIALAPPDGALGTETYNVYRVTPDGAYPIAEGCGLTETVIDPYAPYGGEVGAYRVAVVTVDGDVDWLDYEYRLHGRDLRIDFGDSYVELPWNLSVTDGYEKDFEARRKLDGTVDGYWNDGVARTGGFSTDLIRIMEWDKARMVRELASYAEPAFVRTPDGCAYQANVTVTSIGGARRDAALAVQLDATEVTLTDEYRALLPDREEEEEEP